MDIVDTSLGLAGTAFRLVMFSIDFVSDAKQVYRKGATDRTFDLALVAKSIQDSTGNLETQLQTVAKDEGEVGKLNSDKVCINIFIWVIRLSIVVTLLDFDCCLFFFFFHCWWLVEVENVTVSYVLLFASGNCRRKRSSQVEGLKPTYPVTPIPTLQAFSPVYTS